MKEQSRLGNRALKRAVQLAAATLAIAGMGAVGGCLSRPIEPQDPRTTSVVVDKLTQSGVNKIDLVLVVDNSASMADKQYILSLAIPDLVTGLINPRCLDNKSMSPMGITQPTDPLAMCPAGSTREFPPVLDIHIGLLSSSLGTFGADGCPDAPPTSCTGMTPNSNSNDDHGRLVTRTDPCGSTDVPTYQSKGFLAWDPAKKLMPNGETSLPNLVTNVTSVVTGDGQLGCGFESQNEAWYRFLVDPTPYKGISLVNNQVQLNGVDQTLLDQRKAFLRPDSLLAIVNVTDETDTSIKQYSSYPLFAAPELHLPHPTSACAGPNGAKDPCCVSCGQGTPMGCTADPKCTSAPSYTAADESTSIRAFGLISHKQRYGIEFFYQPSRYVSALTSPTVNDVNNKQVANPIYSNLDPTNYTGAIRDPGLVFYAAIVGVPWQLIARQKGGVPDLINGVSAIDPTQVGGFKTAKELSLADPMGNVFWDDIAGDPENYVLANSPFMQESTVPRSGTDPITGAAISPPGTANGAGSKVGGAVLNDHERTIKNPAPDDIEYACIFDLPAGHTKDCSVSGTSCDCPSSGTTDNPLCEGTMQVRAKAYPGIKHLAIARGMGSQGIAASICPKQLTDPTAADYGYHPAVQAIIDRLKQALHGQCLPRQLVPNAEGQVQCLILEASNTPNCNCAGPARSTVSAEHQPAVDAAKADPLDKTANWNCFCEINQLQGSALTDCQTATNPAASTDGWCYVDASQGAPEAAIVAKCPPTEQRQVRFVGSGAPSSGATLFITCAGQ